MSTNIFRIFKPAGSKEDRVQKRRDQLRQAQRTYRDRKDQYTKSLEEELARVRANEVKLLREVQRLQETTARLFRYLHQQGLQFSEDDLMNGGHDGLHSWELGTRERSFGTTPEPIFPGSIGGADELHHHHFPQADHGTSAWAKDVCIGGSSTGAEPHPSGTRMCDLDLVGAGIDFVLTLERPCLGHLDGNPDEPDQPTGHALTTSAQVLSTFPESSPGGDLVSAPLHLDVPTATLESLLSLSSELCLDEEVTPVQVWNYIRCQPQFGGLEARSLYRLSEILRDAVKCHGFGAVVARDIFEKSVSQILLDGRAF
ncbi:hypothetical protein NKR19_g9327 [Coniochaeta hoffmannii]|uniref:BZIP domain-containing protein n=1 Tax=Coniochaeta hoffmannii TaxID=91930 RepID=A0AA38RCD7_9PEZI|nr:hypothetical protein NKR19_g9327 [Coniochaeta hoffmannii]